MRGRFNLDVSGQFFELGLALDGRLEEWRGHIEDADIAARNIAVEEIGARAKAELRHDVASSGLRRAAQLQTTWRGDMVVDRRVRDPAYWIYTEVEEIIAAFDKGERISVDDNVALAIPIKNSPAAELQAYPGTGSKVRAAEAKWGRLFVIPATAERPAMLAARNVGYTAAGNLRARRRRKRKDGTLGRFKTGTLHSLPLFFLIDTADMPDLLSASEIFDRYQKNGARLVAGVWVREFERLRGP